MLLWLPIALRIKPTRPAVAPKGPQGWLRPLCQPHPCTNSAHSHVRPFALVVSSTKNIALTVPASSLSRPLPGWFLLIP